MTDPLFEVAEATWPAAATQRVGPWTIRDGAGGGKRVSATTATARWTADDLAMAETAMETLGQAMLFMIQDADPDLDAALAARGYDVIDPVWIYRVGTHRIAPEPLPHATAMPIWPPLAVQREIWAEGGIGPARLAVMDRVQGRKTSILGRTDDQPAGTAFVAVHDGTAMIHAIETAPQHRRKGVGANMIRAAARWAISEGAETLSLLVTKANRAANALYTSLGMESVGQYHYRVHHGGRDDKSDGPEQ